MAKKVLVVDDEPNILKSLEFLISRAGFDVELAKDGNEALNALQGPPPDLIILDVMMPGFDGYEICERIRSMDDWKTTKVVMLTARGQKTEMERALSVGADEFVAKPFSTRELVAKVKSMLDD